MHTSEQIKSEMWIRGERPVFTDDMVKSHFARALAEQWFNHTAVVDIATFAVEQELANTASGPLLCTTDWIEKIIARKAELQLKSES